MSEMESVNILPGPHDPRPRASLEELESNEPLLQDSGGNERRAGVIKRARAELDGRGCGKRDEYARAYELLGMLTPTSRYDLWCQLRDELARLGDDAAGLVGPECELVRIDTLKSIKNDSDLVSKIHGECAQFVDERESRLHDLEHRLLEMMRHVGDSKQGKNVRRYIVDMARFNSVTDDRMALRVILAVYVEQKLYSEACDVCEEILGFEGDDRDAMASSYLVETVIDRILIRLSESHSPERHGALVQRCIALLLRRSEALTLNQRLGQGPKLQQASRLAFNIIGRRRLRTPEEIGGWIRKRYPESYRLLNMGGKKIEEMVEKSTTLAEHASVQITCAEIAGARQKAHDPDGALDELERLIRAMNDRGIDTQKKFKQWSHGIPGDALWESISGLRIYLRLVLEHGDVTPHPEIGDGKRMDLRVDDCYVEVLATGDGTPLLSRQQVDDAALADRAIGKIMTKSQLCAIGDRTVVLILDCSRHVFDSDRLRGRLLDSIREAPQPGGVFVVLFEGSRYLSKFVANPDASHPVPKKVIDTMARTLGATI